MKCFESSPNISTSSSSRSSKICRICHVVESARSTSSITCKITRPVDSGKKMINNPNILLKLKNILTRTYHKLFEKENVLSDELIAPCKCRGTMQYVHRDCLNQWRTASPRSDSFTRCEQCFTTYTFKNTWLTSLIIHPLTIYFICTVLFVSWIAASTFVSTGALYHHQNDLTTTSQDELLNLLPTIYFNFNSKNGFNPLNSFPFISNLIFCYNDFMDKFNGLFYGLIFVSLTEFIFFTPSFILSFNTLFCLWRIQRYEIFFDKWLLVGFTGFGIWRAGRSLHFMIDSALSRIVKLKLLEVIDREVDVELDSLDADTRDKIKTI